MKLYEILVPTKYGDTNRPIRTKHHKNWDMVVRKLAGGLTILSPAKGQWVYQHDVYEERVIPVRIMCDPIAIREIVRFTLSHYRQISVMWYVVSEECEITYSSGLGV